MERTTTLGGNLAAGSNNANPIGGKVEEATQAAHTTTDKIANKATTGVDRSTGAVHRAVDSAANAATSAAEWASKQVQTRLTESASASIRARPIATVAGALAVGYLLGRLARL
jgi:hypothetical protein